jgi:hypothetical protein
MTLILYTLIFTTLITLTRTNTPSVATFDTAGCTLTGVPTFTSNGSNGTGYTGSVQGCACLSVTSYFIPSVLPLQPVDFYLLSNKLGLVWKYSNGYVHRFGMTPQNSDSACINILAGEVIDVNIQNTGANAGGSNPCTTLAINGQKVLSISFVNYSVSCQNLGINQYYVEPHLSGEFQTKRH